MACIRLVRRTAMQTAVRMITTGDLMALLAGIAIKLKTFGGGPEPRPMPSISPTAPALEAGLSFLEAPHDDDLPPPLARRAGEQLALAELQPAGIACRGTGKLLKNGPAPDMLWALRDRPGKPRIVRSAYRSLEHNRAVGGARRRLWPIRRLLLLPTRETPC
ncbi:hypothetical protein ROA7023_04424 [Roseisalinus antarcticus]|uniref:Peptidase M15A C-terminal domain-containing protein n=1 Tax=Roseisalinus antarcticus TaxID=254357 RepID=A0A1Y5U5A7_9RHOB|nr:hypothetical protein ROA7023_04424 [Roseisalinus antarcticus]